MDNLASRKNRVNMEQARFLYFFVKEHYMKALYRKFDTSGHFPDFWHTAKGQRDNKKIRARKERRMLNEERTDDYAEPEGNGPSLDMAQEQDG